MDWAGEPFGVLITGTGPHGCPPTGCGITPGVVLVAAIVLAVCLLIGYLTKRRK